MKTTIFFVENITVQAIVIEDKGVMRTESESDLERLQRQVEKSKTLVHQSAIKVEELEASMRSIGDLKDRFIVFPRNKKRDPTDE